MESFSIGPVRPEEAGSVLDVQSESFSGYRDLFKTHVWTGETVDEFLAELPSATVLVARDARGQIVGAVRGRNVEGVWVIRKLCVSPSRQSKGVGRSLMRAVEEAVPSGCHKISVCTMLVLGQNVRFFLSLGYEPESLMPDHYNRLHLLCFRKILLPLQVATV